MNTSKKSSNPKRKVTEPGKSTRTKYSKAVEDRVGWENGRSRKAPVRYPKKYLRTDKLHTNVSALHQMDIQEGLYPLSKPKIKTHRSSCRINNIPTRAGATDTCNGRLDSLCLENNVYYENFITANFWVISPNDKSLVISTCYKKNESDEYQSTITKIRL